MPRLLPMSQWQCFNKQSYYTLLLPLKREDWFSTATTFLLAIHTYMYVLSKPVQLSLVTLNQHKHAMESAIGLCFSTFPNHSICFPPGLYAARATKPRLSSSQYSYLSLPRVSANHPIEHIPAATTSMVDGSLHPTYNRVDKGRPANLAWASPFLRNIGSGRSTKHRGNAVETDAPSPYITHYTEVLFYLRQHKLLSNNSIF